LLAEAEVGSVLVVVANVFVEKSLQVPLVERNHVVEQIASTALNPAFRDSILPRALVGGLKSANFHRAYGDWNLQSIFLIAIKD
jgi:hypothetical protein